MNRATAEKEILRQIIQDLPEPVTTERLIQRCIEFAWVEGAQGAARSSGRGLTYGEVDSLVAKLIEEGRGTEAIAFALSNNRRLTIFEQQRLATVLIKQHRCPEAVEVLMELRAPCPP